MLLRTSFRPHRPCMPAYADARTLYVALDLWVQSGSDGSARSTAAAGGEAGLGVIFVVDTSSSMGLMRLEDTEIIASPRVVAPGETRLAVVIDALDKLVKSERVRPDHRFALVNFDDEAHAVIGFTSASETEALLAAIRRLSEFGTGTQMGKGLRLALSVLGTSGTANERVVLLTDGNTSDEELVRDVTASLAAKGVSVIGMGLGADWNAQLLLEITERTKGRPLHIVDDAQFATDSQASEPVSQFPQLLANEVRRAASEILTDVRGVINTVRDVRLVRLTQVEPLISETSIDEQGLQLGNLGLQKTVFLLEFQVGQKPPGRVRLAQLGLTYRQAGSQSRAEIAPRDLVVEFSDEESRTNETDREVLDYVAARNVANQLDEAVASADSDPANAERILTQVTRLAGRINPALTAAVGTAIGQLRSGKTLSLSARKTLTVGAKTKTRQSEGVGGLSDEEIRRISGV
jgi:Ca-activated chloride channel homolog